MSWLRRRGGPPGGSSHSVGTAESTRAVERSAPGIRAFFDGVPADRSHAVLDLGGATEGSLEVYSRYATRIRFADLMSSVTSGTSWSRALEELPSFDDRPYDLLVLWDVLHRLAPELRPALVRRLVELSAPGARMYFVMDVTDRRSTRPIRCGLTPEGRVRQEEIGPPEHAWPRLLPAEVARLVAPFEVVHAFVLKLGMREYVTVRSRPW